MEDQKIVRQVMEENKKGLRRLAREEPAAERRSKLKKFKRIVLDIFENEKKVGRITVSH